MRGFNWLSKWWKKDLLRPCGAKRGDGLLQLSFTLPIPPDEKAREAALALGKKLGLSQIEIASMESASPEFSTFILYGKTDAGIAYTKLTVAPPKQPSLSFRELNRLMDEKMKRPLVVVGASLGGDTYAVSMDMLLSSQGVAGDYGLEGYFGFRVHHLRGTLTPEEILNKAEWFKADVLLIAPSGSPKGEKNAALQQFMTLLKAREPLYRSLLPIAVDTHLTEREAKGMGIAQAFAPKTPPLAVANFIVETWLRQGDRA